MRCEMGRGERLILDCICVGVSVALVVVCTNLKCISILAKGERVSMRNGSAYADRRIVRPERGGD